MTPREEDGWSKRKVRIAVSQPCTQVFAQADGTDRTGSDPLRTWVASGYPRVKAFTFFLLSPVKCGLYFFREWTDQRYQVSNHIVYSTVLFVFPTTKNNLLILLEKSTIDQSHTYT